MQNIHNKINYIELGGEKTEEVKNFYKEVFGWNFTEYGPTYMAYEEDEIGVGFDASRKATEEGAVPIFYTNNLEESQQKIEVAGGEIMIPVFEFPGGRRFHFKDPSGNHLAIWTTV